MQNIALSSVVAIQNPSRRDFDHWFKDGNDAAHLTSELFPGYNVALGLPIVSSLTVSAEDAIKAQEARRDWLFDFVKKSQISVKVDKGTVNILLAEVEKAWDLTYRENTKKRGRVIIVPNYEQVLGLRRLACMVFVNAIHVHRGEDPILELPMEVQELDASNRIMANLTENLKKVAGAKGLSQEDEVYGARQLYFLGGKEGDFQRAGFSRFKAQKMFALFTIDKRFPDEGFADQVITGKLNWSAIDKDTILALRDEGPIEAVAACLKATHKVNKDPIMTKVKIAALEDQNPVHLVKITCQSILKNNAGLLSRYTSKAKEINLAEQAILDSDPIMMKALADITETRKQVSEIKSA